MAGGEWVQKRHYWWQYCIPGQGRPFADVIQQRADGPDGELWDAFPVSSSLMVPLVEDATLDEAKAAVEEHARQQDG